MHRKVGHVVLVDQHATPIGIHQSDDHVEAGSLAGAVRAKQADDLPALDGQADVANDLPALVALGQMLGFEDGHYWAAPRLLALAWLDDHVDPRTRRADVGIGGAAGVDDLAAGVIDDLSPSKVLPSGRPWLGRAARCASLAAKYWMVRP